MDNVTMDILILILILRICLHFIFRSFPNCFRIGLFIEKLKGLFLFGRILIEVLEIKGGIWREINPLWVEFGYIATLDLRKKKKWLI